ncbi:PcfJ domain-containing protein [Patescibacteria group bacterium]|nr:PcfJ domain-containing protein [Patescibacteria group bacterium]MBU4016772.1 PcfJ domain-containing protein [Patescibacteria group bacterium]MBU4098700.1 PcfJ domain-containing protein [Patescibacteria group bacterium]
MRNIERLSGAGIRFVDKKREPNINDLQRQYGKILAGFSDKNRPGKESKISDTFQIVSERLEKQEGFVFGKRQKDILKLKLARHLLKIPKDETIDHNTLYDAIKESPRFLNENSGSLHHLLKTHEQKTVQKIAEMRKKRAEMTGEKGLNPYEALFTTKSGNYYLARLLNMPHLQEESEYMRNCVGTSDSYINRMKKGEIEIFSFRKLEDDAPLLTIEYNLKTGIIEQIKKKNDKYLALTDLFFEDAIDALKQLRDTKNDQGKPREIEQINPNELKDISVKPEHILTDRGEIHFRDIKEKNPFILKAAEIKPTPDITHKDAAKLLQIFEHLEFKPEQIAHQPNEINKNTKTYVGKLEPGIFGLIQQYNIEHIYTQFPEGKVGLEKDFEVGPITLEEFERKREQYNKTVTDESQKIEIGSYAEEMMKSKDFATLKKPEQMTLVWLKVRNLGVEKHTTIEEIYHHAQKLGLDILPPEAAPYLLLRHINQLLGKGIGIGTKKIIDESGSPRRFELERSGWGRTLGGREDSKFSPSYKVVFRLPK